MSDKYLMPTYSRQPVMFERGEGCWLYDDNGNAYLDGIAGIAVCNLGHCHPAITRALTEQAQKLVHTSNLYRIDSQEKLATALCTTAQMENVFFSNSGAEANEAAIKLARLYGNKKNIDLPTIIVMEGAFHGRTMATLTATGNRKVQAGFEPLLSGFARAPWNDLDAIKKIIASNHNIVAVFLEPIQGEGGVNPLSDGFLKALRALCDEHALLLMLDEIQTGNGRTGSYFAYQQEGIVPDVVTTAKGLGNGFPIGACLTSGRASDLFSPGNHGSTYGGNPLGCSTALAVVETLNGGVIDDVRRRGALLRRSLRDAFADTKMVIGVRGQGLINAVQFDRPCTELVGLCRERGLLINVTAESVVRLIPPLVINDDEIALLVERLQEAVIAFAKEQEAA